MRTEVVEYAGQELTAKFTVSEATVLMGMARARLRRDAERNPEKDEDRLLLRLLVYPDICAGVVASDGMAWPPTFEQFLELPDGLDARLEEVIYRLNPHWLAGGAPATDPKAPAPPSTSGSRIGRRRKTKTASSSPT